MDSNEELVQQLEAYLQDADRVHIKIQKGYLGSEESGNSQETEKLRTTFFAVPMEVRGPFLVLLVRESPRDLRWLATRRAAGGAAGPQALFFWAMHITETLHQNLQVLFCTQAKTEEQQPYLPDSAMWRGSCCLVRYQLGDCGWAWNRCWVVDTVATWAVVMVIDCSWAATILAESLRSLDSDDLGTVPPLAQPFILEKGILNSNQVIYHILNGNITGALNLELHTLKFEEFK
ncbi:LOW QUALITY PROTEIN: tudor domain-containing protein 10 [Pteronotus mesoamericanus]|uniref:LOW QUALITY PROTEIN: tudor domain-containing protein 10 n=1 Tax=Pteronotus mesoamericanus TaxID=1884717 RepID=UPI0023EABE73|nr:LOW QUALITY PROTEIN: tudor domain-containing protein 10 [Pteronotus parnellii mesoamericanus]